MTGSWGTGTPVTLTDASGDALPHPSLYPGPLAIISLLVGGAGGRGE